MSSAGLAANVPSSASQASLTGSPVTASRAWSRRVMPMLISAPRLSISPSVYKTRVLPVGSGRRVAW